VLAIDRTGFGFGTKRFPGISNVLRATSFVSAASELDPASARHERDLRQVQGDIDETVGMVEFEVDDQSPEDIAVAIDQLLSLPEVLDVRQTPSFGKKGRLGVNIRIICENHALQATAQACFAQFTTLGVRLSSVRRLALARENHTVATEHGPVRVKRARRPDGAITAKVEMDDLTQLRTHRDRQLERDRAERAASSIGDDDPTSQS
jgi:uncharacterized protein (DUF111 family)